MQVQLNGRAVTYIEVSAPLGVTGTLIAGSFRISLVIELVYPQDLQNMPWQFYDK